MATRASLPLLLLLLPLLLLSVVTRQASGFYVLGSGEAWNEEVYQAWNAAYQYVLDDVLFAYQPTTTVSSGLASLHRGFSTFVSSSSLSVMTADSSSSSSSTTNSTYLIPVFGSALTFAYHPAQFPNSSSSSSPSSALQPTNLVALDEAALVALFTGDLSTWSDPRWAALNPYVGMPATPGDNNITLVLCNDTLGQADVLERYLARASPSLASVLSGGGGLASLAPFLQGRVTLACSGSEKVAALSKPGWEASLVMMMLPELRTSGSGLSPIAYVTNASQPLSSRVVASPASITAAMNAVNSSSSSSLDLSNAGQGGAWPLSTFSFMYLDTGITTIDCSKVKELLSFVSWTQINDGAGAALAKFGSYAGLASASKNVMLKKLEEVQCGGSSAQTTAYVLGQGMPFPTYQSWARAYSSASFRLKYFEGDLTTGLQTFASGGADFGVTVRQLTATDYQSTPDLMLVPSVAFGYNFCYNIPDLLDEPMSVLMDFSTIADIYLSKIKTWNHPNITRLNPGLTLPNASIRVSYVTGAQTYNLLYNSVLSATVREFAVRVGPTTTANYPVVSDDPSRTLPCSTITCVVETLQNVPYSFSGGASYIALTTPNVRQLAMFSAAGKRVEAVPENILAAIDNAPDPTSLQIILAPGNNSWPMVTYSGLLIKGQSYPDCNKAKALVDWIYWTQTSDMAKTIANVNKVSLASQVERLRSTILTQLANVTCDGVFISSIYGCVSQGLLCSDRGTCTSNQCSCQPGFTGQYCESIDSKSSSDVLAPVLGSVLPTALIALILVLAAAIIIAIIINRRKKERDDWEVDYDEIEVGELLGEGGFGQVHKAVWKGSDVAVKVMATSEADAKSMVSSFKEEIRVMSHLRHPNVVLFMAACTKPPKMCIVMEYMQLGSLYELIHNSLIPELPRELKVKMLYQAAKGMQFLHSSGIVHRDLKSLNLLLDQKWNVKVSDFGLTRFKASLKAGGEHHSKNDLAGTVPWMAPEILEEVDGLDYSLADVYAYGVIMWEVMTRKRPYDGLLPAQIAVSVIRNDLRPSTYSQVRMADEDGALVELMNRCWHRDASMRPVFIDIMKQLQGMVETQSSGSYSGSSSTGSSYHRSSQEIYSTAVIKKQQDQTRSSTHNSASYDSGSLHSAGASVQNASRGSSVAPRQDVCFVVCDLARCNESWENNPAGTAQAIAKYGKLVRDLCNGTLRKEEERHDESDNGSDDDQKAAKEADETKRKVSVNVSASSGGGIHGYLFSQSMLHSGGTFMLAFGNAFQAASFGLALQGEVDKRRWPSGVKVRSRVCVSYEPGISAPPAGDLTRTGYDRRHFEEACRLNVRCRAGAVICSDSYMNRFMSTASETMKQVIRFKPYGGGGDAFRIHDGAHLAKNDLDFEDDGDELEADEHFDGDDKSLLLCSSNWCQWIISKDKISIGDQIGDGSYGRVFSGTYFGAPVAVKVLYRSKLDDMAMIKLRKEAAILSGLNHPNVVKLMGLSAADSSNEASSLLLVMELMPTDLRKLLSNVSIKLTWRKKISMLRDAAIGLAYLHSQGVVHRDIKSSNLLVDHQALTVKVGDFGFATAKQDNGTQTRCGTPSWTAPEILAGTSKHTEKADIYSFGIVMWEVLTRKVPYHDKRMVTVALDVIGGQRPPVPADCPQEFAEIMQRCWAAKPSERVSMDDILMYLHSQLDADTNV